MSLPIDRIASTLDRATVVHEARRYLRPVRVAEFMISGLDHRWMRLSRISTADLGMSGFRLSYVVTLFR